MDEAPGVVEEGMAGPADVDEPIVVDVPLVPDGPAVVLEPELVEPVVAGDPPVVDVAADVAPGRSVVVVEFTGELLADAKVGDKGAPVDEDAVAEGAVEDDCARAGPADTLNAPTDATASNDASDSTTGARSPWERTAPTRRESGAALRPSVWMTAFFSARVRMRFVGVATRSPWGPSTLHSAP